MTRHAFLAAWLVGVLAVGEAHAIAGARLLNTAVSVREAGMGEVGVGGGDALAAWSNPAFLAAQSRQGVVGFSGGSMFGGDLTAFGIGAGWLLSPRWALGVVATSYASKFPEVGETGDATGDTIVRGVRGYGAAVAWRPGKLSAGIMLKGTSDDLAGNQAGTFAADAGAALSVGDVTVAAAMRNLGGDLRPGDSMLGAEALPGELRAAVAWRIPARRITVGAEAAKAFEGGSGLGAGVEWWPVEAFGVRGGVRREEATALQITAGLSAAIRGWSIDYAAVTHPLGLNHRVGLSCGFGKTAGELAAGWAERKAEEPAAVPETPAPSANRGARKNVAVADLAAQNVSAGDAAVISDMLRSEMIRSRAWNVVEKQNMEKILAEQAFQQSGCTSEGCAVKLGKLLNVQMMIVGSFGKLLTEYFVTIRVIDVQTGESVYAKTAKAANVGEVESAIKGVVAEMGKTLR